MNIDEAIGSAARKAIEAVAALEAQGLSLRNPEDVAPETLLGGLLAELEHVARHLAEETRMKAAGEAVPAEEAECATIALRRSATIAILLWAASPHSVALGTDTAQLN